MVERKARRGVSGVPNYDALLPPSPAGHTAPTACLPGRYTLAWAEYSRVNQSHERQLSSVTEVRAL